MPSRSRWAVVGGSGFVGSSIVSGLRTAGYDVVVVRAPRLLSDSYAGGGVATIHRELALASIQSVIDALAAEFRDCSIVINAAGIAQASAPASSALFGANALLPPVVRAAAEQAGATRFVHISSAAVQDRRDPLTETADVSPRTPYASAKALGETALQSPSASRYGYGDLAGHVDPRRGAADDRVADQTGPVTPVQRRRARRSADPDSDG